MSEWSRVLHTTISNFIKGEEVNVLRNRKVTAVCEAKGRVSFNWSGDKMVWRVRYRRHPMSGYADSEILTFPRRDRWKTAELDWRSYAMTDSMTKGERLKNRGPQQIIDVYESISTSLLEDMQENFGDAFYHDGNASGYTKGIHGIESFMGSSGTSLDYVASPSDTFAGLSTVLGNYGGSASGAWPLGTADSHYDFWSPLLVDYTDAAWEASTKTWVNTCVEALRFAIITSMRNKTKKGSLDLFLLHREMYRQWLNRLDEKERIHTERSAANSTLIKLGWTDVQNFDGCDVTFEYGTPLNTGYGFNMDHMEIRSQQSQLFVPETPDYEMSGKSTRFSLDFFGNVVWNPRFFTKLKNYT